MGCNKNGYESKGDGRSRDGRGSLEIRLQVSLTSRGEKFSTPTKSLLFSSISRAVIRARTRTFEAVKKLVIYYLLSKGKPHPLPSLKYPAVPLQLFAFSTR